MDPNLIEDLTLEGQIVRISDAVAYLNHDLADAFRAGVIDPSQVPKCVFSTLGERHSERVNTMVTDIVTNSWAATGHTQSLVSGAPIITMSNNTRKAINTLREFMFSKVYVPEDLGCEGKAARNVIRLLFYHYKNNRAQKQKHFPAPDTQLQDRLIFSMLNQAAACLEESIVEEPEFLDAGVIFGAGFPPFTGGPIKYAQEIGIGNIVERLTQLGQEFGPRFHPHRGWSRLHS